ncbi:MAG: DUF3990 domain-containing protein [Mogibacterium sp.]|nr:DUF3990 domain-containing protein [Mogibacterium sp.]
MATQLDLYHGSPEVILRLQYDLGRRHNEFGPGFYCTENESMAREWACSSVDDGFVNHYQLDLDGLRVLDLNNGKDSLLNWLAVAVAHRLLLVKTPAAARMKRYLVEQYSIDLEAYDVVIGYHADDASFGFVEAFLDGDITEEKLSRAMGLGKSRRKAAKSNEQVVLKSQRAVDRLRFIDFNTAERDRYYLARKARNDAVVHATRELYRSKAMERVGDAFDFAVNELGMSGADFAGLFVNSRLCRRLENAEPRYLFGKSGVEFALEVVAETTGRVVERTPAERYDRSPEYWCGAAVAYYQWQTGISYKEIFRVAEYDEIRRMYEVLHESEVSRFADAMEQRRRLRRWETNLKRIRSAARLSQSGLAEASGVSLRSIQMYEQRNKDINKAQAATVRQLARALGCQMADLLEPEPEDR